MRPDITNSKQVQIVQKVLDCEFGGTSLKCQWADVETEAAMLKKRSIVEDDIEVQPNDELISSVSTNHVALMPTWKLPITAVNVVS